MAQDTDLLYFNLLESILQAGVSKDDRTGTGTKSLFGRVMRFDISDGKLPLLSTKKVFYNGIIHELLWMLSGDTNIRYLKQHGVGIWDSWIKPETAEYVPLSVKEMQRALETHPLGILKRHQAEVLQYGFDVTLGMGAYRVESSEDDSGTITLRYNGVEAYKKAYLDFIGLQPRKLVAGELPKIYQHQWRKWEDTRVVDQATEAKLLATGVGFRSLGVVGDDHHVITREIDQLANLIEQIKTNPDSRRLLFTAWNVAEIEEMALPPCHLLAQFWTRELSLYERLDHLKKQEVAFKLKETEAATHASLDALDVPKRAISCLMYQRSADTCLGVPFNLVQYALLTHLIAQSVNMLPEDFIWVGGDVHVYDNQHEGARVQLGRNPITHSAPRVVLNAEVTNLFDFSFEDIQVVDYEPHPAIQFPPAAV